MIFIKFNMLSINGILIENGDKESDILESD